MVGKGLRVHSQVEMPIAEYPLGEGVGAGTVDAQDSTTGMNLISPKRACYYSCLLAVSDSYGVGGDVFK